MNATNDFIRYIGSQPIRLSAKPMAEVEMHARFEKICAHVEECAKREFALIFRFKS